jgi:hypothetical protein
VLLLGTGHAFTPGPQLPPPTTDPWPAQVEVIKEQATSGGGGSGGAGSILVLGKTFGVYKQEKWWARGGQKYARISLFINGKQVDYESLTSAAGGSSGGAVVVTELHAWPYLVMALGVALLGLALLLLRGTRAPPRAAPAAGS